MPIAQQHIMIRNAVVFVYVLLASFPCIGGEERAAVQLVMEHVFTFNVRLGRIVLTHQGYEHAQGLGPQLLVLASHHGLVYATGRTLSFMNIATILQTIIEPLVINFGTLAWMEVFATEDEARQLLKLSLPRLQVAVDTWVCEYSEIALPKLASIASSQNNPTSNLPAQVHSDVWWTSPLRAKARPLPTGPEVISKSTPAINLSNHSVVYENVNVPQTPQLRDNSSALGDFEPVSPNLVSTLFPRKNPSHDLCAKKHTDVWWTLLRPVNTPSLSTGSETVHSKPAPGPLRIHSHNPTTRGHEDVWWKSYARGESPGAKCSTPVISKPVSTPASPNDNHRDSPAIQEHEDVWWKSPHRAQGHPLPIASELAVCSNPASTLIISQPLHPATHKHSDVWWVSSPQNKLSIGKSTLLQPIGVDICGPDELHHPHPVPVSSLCINLLEDRPIKANNTTISTATPHSSTQDFWSQPGGILHEAPTSLCPPSIHPPWDSSSGAYSSSRDFSTSDPSSGPPTPMRSWGHQFSGSSPSFGPLTSADSVSARWDYDHYVASLDWTPQWDEGSMSDDVHERPQTQPRKAKEVTMGRKLARKLKAVLASIRKMSP
ncbi:hypothetical protein FRC10_010853 [Ceratobasidium sp. 414]|nr:hypothetical protein FRC10_010853 [Ceratobasidium sp. 414]